MVKEAHASPMANSPLGAAVRSGNYTAAVKLIDPALQEARRGSGAGMVQLLCNRAYCYHQLGLLRKAIKVRAMCTRHMVHTSGVCLPCARCRALHGSDSGA